LLTLTFYGGVKLKQGYRKIKRQGGFIDTLAKIN
jgi:hypothetical protein